MYKGMIIKKNDKLRLDAIERMQKKKLATILNKQVDKTMKQMKKLIYIRPRSSDSEYSDVHTDELSSSSSNATFKRKLRRQRKKEMKALLEEHGMNYIKYKEMSDDSSSLTSTKASVSVSSSSSFGSGATTSTASVTTSDDDEEVEGEEDAEGEDEEGEEEEDEEGESEGSDNAKAAGITKEISGERDSAEKVMAALNRVDKNEFFENEIVINEVKNTKDVYVAENEYLDVATRCSAADESVKCERTTCEEEQFWGCPAIYEQLVMNNGNPYDFVVGESDNFVNPIELIDSTRVSDVMKEIQQDILDNIRKN